MNVWDFLILAAVAAMVAAALRVMRKKKSACGCGCSGCDGRSGCPHCAGKNNL